MCDSISIERIMNVYEPSQAVAGEWIMWTPMGWIPNINVILHNWRSMSYQFGPRRHPKLSHVCQNVTSIVKGMENGLALSASQELSRDNKFYFVCQLILSFVAENFSSVSRWSLYITVIIGQQNGRKRSESMFRRKSFYRVNFARVNERWMLDKLCHPFLFQPTLVLTFRYETKSYFSPHVRFYYHFMDKVAFFS